MDNYGINCIFLNNDCKCDLGNDTMTCDILCKDQMTYEQYEENHTQE